MPIYLQLFESLRRISEGEPGAAICRECGRPFLVLDARRRFFCNERERFRHAKRGQRKRLAALHEEAHGVDATSVVVHVSDGDFGTESDNATVEVIEEGGER